MSARAEEAVDEAVRESGTEPGSKADVVVAVVRLELKARGRRTSAVASPAAGTAVVDIGHVVDSYLPASRQGTCCDA